MKNGECGTELFFTFQSFANFFPLGVEESIKIYSLNRLEK